MMLARKHPRKARVLDVLASTRLAVALTAALLLPAFVTPTMAGSSRSSFDAVQVLPPRPGQAPSAAYSNASKAIDLLRSKGHTKEADQLKQLLDDGKIYFDPDQSENGDTSTATNDVTLTGGLFGHNRSTGTTSVFGDDRGGKRKVTSLARTLLHELVHVNQSAGFIMSSNAQELAGGAAYHETLAWNRTISAMRGWLESALTAYENGSYSSTRERLATVYEIADLLGNLRSYAGSFATENNYYGATDLADNYDDLARKLNAISARLDEDINGMRNELGPADTAARCDARCRPERGAWTVADIRARDAERAAGEAEKASAEARAELAKAQPHHDDLERRDNQARADLAKATTPDQRMDAATRIGQLGPPLQAARSRLANATRTAGETAAAAKAARTAAAAAHARAAAARAAYEACIKDCLQTMLDEGAVDEYTLPAGASVDADGKVRVGPTYGVGTRARPTTETSRKPSYQKLIDDLKTNSLASALPSKPEEEAVVSSDPSTWETFPSFAGEEGMPISPWDYIGGEVLAGNDPVAAAAPVDPTTQRMISIIDDLQPIVVLAGTPAVTKGPAVARAARSLWNLLTGDARAAWPRALLSTARDYRRTEIWLEPVSASGAPGQQKASGTPAIRAFVTSLGTSTGEAFQVHIVNDSGRPVRVGGGSLVLEPIAGDAQAKLQRQVQELSGNRNVATVKMNAYCLEFLRAPPAKGMMFRIAGKDLQQRFGPMRSVLNAARKLQQAGLLKPDSDPTAYFHAIRQWSIWTKEQGFDLKAFGRAFVERTKQNLEELGQNWSTEIEQAVRARVPGRWQDIQQVLREAGRTQEER